MSLPDDQPPQPPQSKTTLTVVPDHSSVTLRVLESLDADKQSEKVAREEFDPFEEEIPHGADERWLISYADMMTLLFGFFVLLYSMVDKFDEIQVDLSDTFTTKTTQRPTIKMNVDELRKMLHESQEKVKDQEKTITDLEKKVKDLQAVEEQNKALRDENADLKIDNEEMKNRLEVLANANPKFKSALAKDALKKIQAENTRLQVELATMKKMVAELQAKLALASASGSYIAVIMRWPTTNHDIDLVVTDPNGVTFNYKHRKKENYPGLFALDTRQGPGAEIWQSDQAIPGTYSVQYVFYNQYGNKEAAPVSGSIMTSKGAFEVPAVTLRFEDKKTATFTFTVDKNGKITLNGQPH